MDLRIPNIVKPIELKEYASEFEDAKIYVWVNPTRALRGDLTTLFKGEATDEQVGAWFSEIWSKGPEGTHFTPEEVLKMAHECMEQDPQLWLWLSRQTFDLLIQHYSAKKKPLS